MYYSQQTIAKGWGRDLMVNAIKLEMHKSQTSSNGSNNFAIVLPDSQAAYANEVFKDTYNM